MTPSWFLSLDATHKIQVRSTFTFSIFFFSYGHTRYIHTGFFPGTTDAVKREKRKSLVFFRFLSTQTITNFAETKAPKVNLNTSVRRVKHFQHKKIRSHTHHQCSTRQEDML